jgi:hypothetical protein
VSYDPEVVVLVEASRDHTVIVGNELNVHEHTAIRRSTFETE